MVDSDTTSIEHYGSSPRLGSVRVENRPDDRASASEPASSPAIEAPKTGEPVVERRRRSIRLGAVRTRVAFTDHPDIPGHSFSKLTNDLERAFDGSRAYEYGMAGRAADDVTTFFFDYHDDPVRGRRDPFAIPPREFARLAKTLVADLENQKSPLWEVVNLAHIRARNESIGQDRRAALAQEIITKLQHDLNYRLKPDIPVDAEALRDLDFRSEELRQRMLQTIRHWSADESLHPVHTVLDAVRRLDPDLPMATRDRHILNKQNMSDLERTLETILRDDLAAHGNRRDHGAHLTPDAVRQVEEALVQFLFYSQPGINPVDIDPAAFANKALELYHDAFFVRHRAFPGNMRRMHRDAAGLQQLADEAARGCFQPETLAGTYASESKYNVFRAFAAAFHRVYAYPVPHETLVAISDALIGSPRPEVRDRWREAGRPLPRLFHEVEVARFGPHLQIADPGARAWCDTSRGWFEAGVAGIDDGRSFLFNRLFQAADPAGKLDYDMLQKLASEMIEHQRVMTPSQRRLSHSIRQDGRVHLTETLSPHEREEQVLTEVATALRDDALWQPFALVCAEHHGEPPSQELMDRFRALVVKDLSERTDRCIDAMHQRHHEAETREAVEQLAPIPQEEMPAAQQEMNRRLRQAGLKPPRVAALRHAEEEEREVRQIERERASGMTRAIASLRTSPTPKANPRLFVDRLSDSPLQPRSL